MNAGVSISSTKTCREPYQVPLVPFLMLRVLGNSALMLPDRVHPNADGARDTANHVWPYLDALLARAGYSRSAT